MNQPTADELGRVYEAMANISEVRRRIAVFYRSKPIISASFAPIGLHLGSMVLEEKGLDSVSFMVIHPETRFVVSVGASKDEALGMARRYIAALGMTRIGEWCHAYQAWRAEELKAYQARNRADFEQRRVSEPAKARISRRRREVFEKAGGSCHYCKTPLAIDGDWHIEHMLPRALGGDNHPDNLTAACKPCNFKKRDLTDVEFIAQQAADRAGKPSDTKEAA